MQYKYCDICQEVKKSVEKQCKQVVFSNYPPFAIVYSSVKL